MPKVPNPFGNMNIGSMLKQVQQLAEDTQRIEQELAEERIEAASGGGMVKAVVNGLAELIEVKIDRQVVDPEDVEMLEDLVTVAVREAIELAQTRRRERLEELTGGFGLPPGFNIPGF